MTEKHWNRCDECGRFIAYADFLSHAAVRTCVTPESLTTHETYWTACRKCLETKRL